LPSPPPDSPGEEVSGLSCPECFDVLNVTTEGAMKTLRFRCRIGHRYSAEEVLAGKERNLEEHLWAPITRLEEIAAYLRDLVSTGNAGDRADTFEARARECAAQRELLLQAMQSRALAGVGIDEAPDE
jgi:two-component system chemotaxis response regulator CheB